MKRIFLIEDDPKMARLLKECHIRSFLVYL